MKQRRLFLLILSLHLLSHYLSFGKDQSSFNVLDYGANPDGTTLCTQSIQSAIDSCHKAGGGYVVFPRGRYLTGTLFLKDNVYLQIMPNTTILGSTNINDYIPKVLIYAKDAQNIGIVGAGFINGQGDFYWRGKQRPYNRPGRTIEFYRCRNAVIRDVHIRNSASFNIVLELCDQVHITGVSIINDLEAPNTDGIDPFSCSNVFISDCYIETGDDAICLKSCDENKPCENVVVSNCVLISDDAAIKYGTGGKGIFRYCSFSNIVIRNTQEGIAFYMKDGGRYEDIQFSNISIEATVKDDQMPNRKATSYAIFMDIEKRDRNSDLGVIRNVMFNNINITTSEGNCLFLGMPEQKIHDITLNNVKMRVLNRSDLSDRHKPRGTRTLTDIAINDYAHISSHFTFAYVDGLNIRDLVIEDETPHDQFERHAIWALDTENIALTGFQQKQVKDNVELSVLKFNNCRNASIRDCKPLSPQTFFLELCGKSTANIGLFGNDFTGVKGEIKFSDDADKKAIYKFGNQRK